MLTESNLNSKNKAQVIEIALELDHQLAEATSGPLTAADVQKRVLDLKRQAQTVRDDAKRRDQEHKAIIDKIKADKEVQIKKLELEYESTLGVDTKELDKAYTALEERAEKAIKELTHKLEKAEADTSEKLSKIEKEISEATQKAKEEIIAWETKVEEAKTKAANEISTINTNHERKLEQIKYDNKLAIRDEVLQAAEQIAGSYDKVVVDSADYDELKDFKASDAAKIKAEVETAVKQAKAEVYAEKGAELSKLKSATDSEIALLKNDKAHLTTQVANDAKRIADLEAQIKGFPEAIAKAVEAAKATVNVNQDAGKK